MKERPILFAGAMVHAILYGEKTQTRRIVKPELPSWAVQVDYSERGWCFNDNGAFNASLRDCPYGEPGDRLWVKETFHHQFKGKTSSACVFRADDDGMHMNPGWRPHVGWKPSIFMPRWASRITLEITGVRCERLNDISEADALSEGIQAFPLKQPRGKRRLYGVALNQLGHGSNAIRGYQILWQSIHGQGSWSANPWVWVIEFKKTTGT